jgi:hypothetical protein
MLAGPISAPLRFEPHQNVLSNRQAGLETQRGSFGFYGRWISAFKFSPIRFDGCDSSQACESVVCSCPNRLDVNRVTHQFYVQWNFQLG